MQLTKGTTFLLGLVCGASVVVAVSMFPPKGGFLKADVTLNDCAAEADECLRDCTQADNACRRACVEEEVRCRSAIKVKAGVLTTEEE